MSMQADNKTGQSKPERAGSAWRTPFAVGAVTLSFTVLVVGALVVLQTNGGSITATTSHGDVTIAVLAPQ